MRWNGGGGGGRHYLIAAPGWWYGASTLLDSILGLAWNDYVLPCCCVYRAFAHIAIFGIIFFLHSPHIFLFLRPTTVMAYTDIQTLRGLSSPVDYGSGIEYADGSLGLRFHAAKNDDDDDDDDNIEASPPPASSSSLSLQLGLWLNGTAGCHDILSGALTDQIGTLFRYLVEETPAVLTYLRIGYEFDNPGFGYSDDPAAYVQAFRTLVDTCSAMYSKSRCRRKVVTVWHSWAAGVPYGTVLSDYYPGDDYVDWIGISIFSQVYARRDYDYYHNISVVVGNEETIRQVLSFAIEHQKPTMIGESTPFGGIPRLPDPWNDWFEPVLQIIDEYDISMWCYINCDWDAQPMWHGAGFGNSRLAVNQTVLALWRERVLQNPRFFPITTTTTLVVAADIVPDAKANTLSSHNGGMALSLIVVVAWTVTHLYRRRSSWTAAYQPILP
jgi:hypothetical protein